ncbi:MAG TPA: carboxypeptidase-like regulatory domain-containing protein [Chitinophaga sp.]
MRYLFFASIMLFCALSSFAQGNLSGSIRYSHYTYIYRLDPREADDLNFRGLGKVQEKHLHTLADSFPTGTAVPLLPPGNYLFVHTDGNKLVYQLHTTKDLGVKTISNDHDLSVAVHTRQGVLIDNAEVRLNHKQLAYNTATKTYGPVRRKKPGAVNVYYNNTSYSFPFIYNGRSRPFFHQLTHSFPLKYITSALRNKRQKRHYGRDYFEDATAYEQQFKGFMVFNKPRYKPGDTVFMKAFVETAKGKPVNRPLILRITDNYFDVDTILADIRPYRAGGYTCQFVLSDSLDLDLDERYMLTLEEESSRKYDLDEYDGDLDEDEYALKRKVLIRGKFKYEEYELQSISFHARSSKETHSRGEQLSIFLKAVDDNEMAVMDGRVNILVKAIEYGATTFHAPKVFLADTLWYHSQPLESLGETKINIPDSIYPRMSFSYDIRCTFLNTNNESQEEVLHQSYQYSPWSLSFESRKDSLAIAYLHAGKPVTGNGKLYALGSVTDTIETQDIQLPAVIKINPFVSAYNVVADSASDSYECEQSAGMVSCQGFRTRDSITLGLVNPHHLPVWYTVFAGNKIILRGYSDTLFYREKIRKPGNCFVALQYIYSGHIYKENYTIPYQDKLLTIHTDQPEAVYPGQKVRVNIEVTDNKGEAVPNADVTAYGFTRKFDEVTPPAIPYFGKLYPNRKFYIFPGIKAKESMEYQAILNWERWSREMKLDTIEYYKFLHPGSIYVNREPAADSISQIAPFIVDKGDLQAVHLIYIDEVPVFFSQATQMQRYSFRVSAGKHSIRLRTSDKLITIDSVWIAKGMKTFLSVDVNKPDNHAQIAKMPEALTKYETQLWSKYMLVIHNNFGENFAYIRQDPDYILLNGGNTSHPYSILAGPFSNQWASLVVKDKFQQHFETEGSWEYIISQGLIRQKQSCYPYLFSPMLPVALPNYDFHDFVLTAPEIDSLWQDYLDKRSSNTRLFQNNYRDKTGNGRLRIGIHPAPDNKNFFVKNIIAFRYDDPDFIEVHPGIDRDLGYFNPGKYRLFFLLKKNRYFIKDSITVLPDGLNYYEVRDWIEKEADSTSSSIARIIEKRDRNNILVQASADLSGIKETFNEKYLDPAVFSTVISGVVYERSGMPIPGATIVVKGTRVGTATDMKGHFSMKVPPRSTIVVSAIGYSQEEVRITQNDYYNIRLTISEAKLEEVVVIGYGTARKQNLTGSIVVANELQGRMAGVMVRGVNSNGVEASPLLIVDGLPWSGKLEDLDQGLFTSMNVLKGAAATAIYGSRAAAGVIIVTTKKMTQADTTDLPLPGNSLRRNFRDHSYWQPKLVTDVNGKASFEVTYPDDITSWRAFTIAMTDHKQSGFLEQTVRSFKALSGNISLPQFAVQGDSMHVIGKTLNYLFDSITVKRTFTVNDIPYKENMISLRNSQIDTFAVIAAKDDSLRLKYTIQRPNGYFDGEERTIPVYPQGVLATSGIFAPLYKDSSFQLALPPDTSAIQLYAETSLLPVWYEEAESIHRYEYFCNEQLASKLKALLAQKRIDERLQRPFGREKNIRELIKQLGQGRSQAGLWGWWANSQPSLWISLHAIEALLDAEKNGYSISVDRKLLADYLIYNLESYRGTEKIATLYLLQQLGAKADFKTYIDSIEKRLSNRPLYERLRLAELKQQLGLPVVLDTFILKQQHTVFGNTYWGEDSYAFFNNAVQNTLCMYRMLKKAGGYEDLLQKTLAYFLEQKKSGHWRNTYESSLVLETILPDLLGADATLKPAALTIQGQEQTSVSTFPFSREIRTNEPLTITKQGSMPVYFTAYRRYWDNNPAKVSGNFEVNSSFEQDGRTLSLLKAGTPVILKVKVDVKADADYVMVEIPIPAGCSYKDKNQSYQNNEVHREYFKNKVSIFCNSLSKGKHEFTISLLPRYTGTYSLNPAKAEMMYFPIFNGREALKKVNIE